MQTINSEKNASRINEIDNTQVVGGGNAIQRVEQSSTTFSPRAQDRVTHGILENLFNKPLKEWFIENPSSITLIDLSNLNNLTEDSIKNVVESIKSNPSSTIIFNNNYKDITSLQNALNEDPSLYNKIYWIDFSQIRLAGSGPMSAMSSFSEKVPNLKRLDLQNVELNAGFNPNTLLPLNLETLILGNVVDDLTFPQSNNLKNLVLGSIKGYSEVNIANLPNLEFIIITGSVDPYAILIFPETLNKLKAFFANKAKKEFARFINDYCSKNSVEIVFNELTVTESSTLTS